MSNYGEPWSWGRHPSSGVDPAFVDVDGKNVMPLWCDGDGYAQINIAPATARRIVACVNACRYLSDEHLAWLAEEERFLSGASLRDIGASMAKFEAMSDPAVLEETHEAAKQVVDSLTEDRFWRPILKKEKRDDQA